jgi:hypothetical protein
MCSRVAASVAYATGSWDKRDNISSSSPPAGLVMPDLKRLEDKSLLGHWMVVNSYQDYEDLAVEYGNESKWTWKQISGESCDDGNPRFAGALYPNEIKPTHIYVPESSGILASLRRNLFLKRDDMSLFDTSKWVRNLESGLIDAWDRFERGWEIQQDRNREALGLVNGPIADDSENAARGQRFFLIEE